MQTLLMWQVLNENGINIQMQSSFDKKIEKQCNVEGKQPKYTLISAPSMIDFL